MKRTGVGIALSFLFIVTTGASGASEAPRSEETQSCIECHAVLHPGIVADWAKSRHARTTPSEGQKRPSIERRVSAGEVSEKLAHKSVGCAECHTLNSERHKDRFEHNGHQVHVVVTPGDCAVCHPTEAGQYEKNLMSFARVNLTQNSVYRDLIHATNSTHTFDGMQRVLEPPHEETNADSCCHCHGTAVEVTGSRTVDSEMGEMVIPVLSGWPNQGVGRFNPDGSKGSCTSCHTRHQFSIAMARKPYTCSQCHKGPDVPAYAVYQVSKHGNIASSLSRDWDFEAVPWKVGKDFTAPTCAACHVSQIVSEEGGLISSRTHQMNDRLAWRLFGVIYAHPHPVSPDTSIIKNSDGLPLPTTLKGERASAFLIDAREQERRRGVMKGVCSSCHGRGWVDGHFNRLSRTIETTNEMTLTATKIMLKAWEKGVASGPAQGDSLFNESIEKKWVEQWLFYANSTRLASAMGGADYGVFANGRWYMSKNIQGMLEWLRSKSGTDE
jgi:hydroxylamine dehydrogenase